MTADQIERLFTFVMFNSDKISTEVLTMLLETDLSKEVINN